MPNWCSNVVTFSGDKNQIKQVLKLFREMGRKGKKQMLGQLPDFISKEQPHFFDIYLKKDNIFILTKWKPNNLALKEIADNFNIGFTNIFDDLPMGLMGEAKYENGLMRTVYLDGFDFQSYDLDGETNGYLFDGTSYDYEWPVLLKILERKTAMVDHNRLQPLPGGENNEQRYKTTSKISTDDLHRYYGELNDHDLTLKLAEFKNFDAARKAFLRWDGNAIAEMAELFIKGYCYEEENFATRDKFLAVAFLKELIQERHNKRLPESEPNLPRKIGR